MYHPYLNGELTPHQNPNLCASFTGVRASHTKGHFNRAVLEGVAFSLLDCKKAIEEMGELTVALCKLDDDPALDYKNEQYIDNVLEEVADVIVMMEQLKLFFGQNRIEELIDFKIDRQIERICMGRD